MSNNFVIDIFNDVIKAKINELLESGMSVTEVQAHINSIDTEKVLSITIDRFAEKTMENLKSNIFEISAEMRASSEVFIANQEFKWGKCFAASDTMYKLAVEAGEQYGEYVDENIDITKKNLFKYTFLCLQHIHGRACQEFLEILYLMKLGFADGAYARWRSMYELSCIASFIIKYGEKIAKQYYEQSNTENQKYSWTKGAINNDKKLNINTFSQLQEACNIREEWKKQYKLACLVNHASPQGTFKRLANGKTLNIIPVGQCDYGITTPAEHSAISLAWITNLFLNIYPYPDGIVKCKVLNSWIDIIRDLYFSTNDELFGDLKQEVKK